MRFEMKSDGQLMNERGMNIGGRVQRFIDQECIRLMDPYTPRRQGNLIKAATLGTKIGSGIIVQAAPQARYLYYGKLMVSKETGSAFASHGESKVLANPEKDLEYYFKDKRIENLASFLTSLTISSCDNLGSFLLTLILIKIEYTSSSDVSNDKFLFTV